MEENKKGSTLYVALGVATLVVAIIGATFAYFSASASVGGDTIQGGTSDVGNALSIKVERVLFGAEKDATGAYSNLVPAVIDVNATGIAKAVNGKCVADGYTGCHLYKITATTQQDLAAANILLHSFDVTGTGTIDKGSWKFVVFTGTEATSEEGEPATTTTTYTVSSIIGNAAQSFTGDAAQVPTETDANLGYNINSGLGLTKGDHVYYLLVYLANKENVQNPTDNTNEHNAVGTYSGSIAFNAAGGKVVANFSSSV
ncbi:MAG: hypothetical protein SOT91_00550 [Bacilli bacterium]|nr:hypothetical protein [Clostridium sp.]MDY2803842.1 hypothetical protein [Bacilli bacterium]